MFLRSTQYLGFQPCQGLQHRLEAQQLRQGRRRRDRFDQTDRNKGKYDDLKAVEKVSENGEGFGGVLQSDLAALVGSVSESEVSSVSSNSAELPLEVLMNDTPSSAVLSEPAHETSQASTQQLRMAGSGLLSVPSLALYNPAASSEFSRYTPAFLAQATASLIQSIGPTSTSHSMAYGGPSSNDPIQFAQMTGVEEEDAFDVAIRELFS